ncbi:hypothetical protein TWF694_005159 [Orbilia ellipsospora]|uniref:Peptidase A1 domain-containing protein n=1 Tax=Orbilia ellipsospora TaxID=2528407 RepID=A0AAV9WV20_9PEZI
MGLFKAKSLLSGFLLLVVTYSQNCSIEPLVVPYGNVTLRSGVQSFGIPLTLGGQNFALKATSNYGISYVFSVPDDCADSTDPIGCTKDPERDDVDEVYLGGIFDTKSSGTYQGPLSWSDVGGGQREESNRAQRSYGYDTIDFGGSLIDKFLFLSSNKALAADINYLALGSNSTILNSLYSLGRVPSKVWSFWGGWTGVTKDTLQQGSLVLGGYDSSKVSGSFASYHFLEDERNCNLRINVKDIKVQAPNGVETSIFDSATTMDACINPTFNSMSIPRNMVDLIAEVGEFTIDDSHRSQGIYGWGFTVPVSENNGFNLIFELENTKITIPNHQLFLPYRFTTDNGIVIVNGSTEQVLQINALQDINRNDLSQLGWPFLSSAYIIVDPDDQTFSVAQAVQSVVSTSSIIPIMASACATETSMSGATLSPMNEIPVVSTTFQTSMTSTKTPSPTNASSGNAVQGTAPQTGVIIGGVLGGIALVSIAGVAGLFLQKRYALKILSRTNRKSEVQNREISPYGVDGQQIVSGDRPRTFNFGGYSFSAAPNRNSAAISRYELE